MPKIKVSTAKILSGAEPICTGKDFYHSNNVLQEHRVLS